MDPTEIADRSAEGWGLPDAYLPQAFPIPEDVHVAAEPIDPNVLSSWPPEKHGLDLGWTAGGPTCGGKLLGYNVYRSRCSQGGGSPNGYIASAQKPAIRLTRQPLQATSMRIDYPLFEKPTACTVGGLPGQAFIGAPGYDAAFTSALAPHYAVTAVYEGGVETSYSNTVRAFTDATGITDATIVTDPNNVSGNTENYGTAFAAYDPNTVLVPGAPAITDWGWRYGVTIPGEGCVGTVGRNWALMKWTPSSGAPNEYVSVL